MRKRLKILIAEDHAINQMIMQSMLTKHQLTIVEDGQKAVEFLSNETVDLVLMDLQMPEMDGITATTFIRDKNSSVINHDVLVIAVTAFDTNEDRERCEKCGMNGFLSKPVNMLRFNKEFRRVLKERRRSRNNSIITDKEILLS